MLLNKENLEIWIMNNMHHDTLSIVLASSISEFFELNTERVFRGLSIVKEYKDTPMLMAQKISELFKGVA